MREEYKLNKAIKKDGVDTQSDILEELKRRYPQYVEQSDNKSAPVRKRRVAVISAFAAVAASVAIIVPCAVLLPNRNNGANNGGNDNRYCTQDEYFKEDAEYTILEYRENSNLNFLYFDWYESCEDCYTFCYKIKADNEVLGLEESVYLPQSDEMITLSFTKANVYLSEFDQAFEKCQSEQFVENHSVKWGLSGEAAICIFTNGGYRYFIQIQQGQDENRLFWWVSELLGKN